MQVLKELGIEVDVYVSSEIDQDAVKVCNNHLFYWLFIVHDYKLRNINCSKFSVWIAAMCYNNVVFTSMGIPVLLCAHTSSSIYIMIYCYHCAGGMCETQGGDACWRHWTDHWETGTIWNVTVVSVLVIYLSYTGYGVGSIWLGARW